MTPTKESSSCCCATDDRSTHRDPKEIKALMNRCSRIEGQIRGIKGMLEKDIYCDDILHQIAAAQSALDSLGRVLLERHMKTCLVARIQEGETEVVDELITTIEKLMR